MTIQDWINWHRTIGFIATVLILMLVVTGLALNHIHDLGLDEIYIENDTLLDWYGITPEKEPVSYSAGNHRITQIDYRLYLDETEIVDSNEIIQGAIILDGVIVAGFENSLYLITEEGELIEKITGLQGLPPDLQGIGLDDDSNIVLRSSESVFYSDLEMKNWRFYTGNSVKWSASEKLPERIEKNLIRLYRGRGLSLERLVADMHSGRLFGSLGIYLIDVSCIVFILLTGTGWWLWIKRRALQKEIDAEL